ncbi:PPOX class F420-dependent oxidoreductase [Nocardia sp. NPDC024068]|uniref:PPOX class F420-dependent oxidoreductase n=1 Tax=Nocardia sp. NPDC024068 TaxID=3157197 RepID=UPI00340AD5EB
MSWDQLVQAKYVLLTTYKKDGSPVGTPVWAAPDGDKLLVWTNPTSWKVKRVRRNPEVTLQISDSRGRPEGGEILTGTAQILDAAGTERTREVVSRKYGIIGRIAIRGHKLFRGADGSVGIAITERPGASG